MNTICEQIIPPSHPPQVVFYKIYILLLLLLFYLSKLTDKTIKCNRQVNETDAKEENKMYEIMQSCHVYMAVCAIEVVVAVVLLEDVGRGRPTLWMSTTTTTTSPGARERRGLLSSFCLAVVCRSLSGPLTRCLPASVFTDEELWTSVGAANLECADGHA